MKALPTHLTGESVKAEHVRHNKTTNLNVKGKSSWLKICVVIQNAQVLDLSLLQLMSLNEVLEGVKR